jgi:hypothetical protein
MVLFSYIKAKNMNKKLLILSIAIFAVSLAGCSYFEQKVNPYPFNSAKIELAQTGLVQGTTTIYFKDEKIMRETHGVKTINGAQDKIDTLYISAGKNIYQVDLNTKTGIQSQNPAYEELQKMAPEKRLDYLKQTSLGAGALTGENAKPGQQKEIAGQKCDLYALQDGSEVCIWDGVVIYEKNNLGSELSSTITATKIETGIDIPDNKFDIPADIKLVTNK